MDHNLHLVIDNGFGTCKAGYASEDAPRSEIPTIVAKPRYTQGQEEVYFVGDEAHSRIGFYPISSPIQPYEVSNWDDMEKIWHHIFYNEMNVSPAEHPVLLTTPYFAGRARDKMAQIMFETFNSPAIFVACQLPLALYSQGSISGVVVDSGYRSTRSAAIWQGYTIVQTEICTDFAGLELTEFMARMLAERSFTFTASELDIVSDLKEKLCYVALEYDQEVQSAAVQEKQYQLPDGTFITIGHELCRCPEALFQPFLVGRDESSGIHEIAYYPISRSDRDIRKALCNNIVLSGGSTMFPGFVARLKRELNALAPDMPFKITAPENRKDSTWVGGSILASLSSFQHCWITRQDYEEIGFNNRALYQI